MTIAKIYHNYNPPVFRLKNSAGKWAEGYYHASELAYLPTKDRKFLQDKVIKRFRKSKKKLVSYKGLDEYAR